MKLLPLSEPFDALVVRTDFANQETWDAICKLIRTPVPCGDATFKAYVELVDDREFRNLTKEELLDRVAADDHRSFLMMVDGIAITHQEFPILVVDLYAEGRGRSFRAIPSQIQGIENNLSIANMDFEEFANAVGGDGIFRGFPAG